jgi:hypothetical protein
VRARLVTIVMAKRRRTNAHGEDDHECGSRIHHPSRSLKNPTLWRVGIISDTHGKYSELSRLGEIFANVSEIWHAGDVAGKDGSVESASLVLNFLRTIAPVIHVVRGNVDKFAGGLRGFSGFCEHPPSKFSEQFPEVR